jgi:Putative stress-responsive transcriptional regulator
VCGGIGEYLDIDPTVIRFIWVILTIVSIGAGILAYLAAWLIIPLEGEGSPEAEADDARDPTVPGQDKSI